MSSPNAYAHIPGIGNATLTLLDSTLEDSSIMVIGLRGDSRIERNVFVNSHHNAFGSPWDSTRIYVTNNVFVQCSGDYVVGLANYSGMSNSQIIFEYNSFLTTNKVALKDLTPIDISVPGRTFNPYILVAKNYWGTTDTRVIDSMIYDRNDDLECFTYFRYQPFLTQPHPDTPSLSEAPLANFTANPRSGINPLTVNFIDQSTGNITNRSWNFGDGATSESQNPSHTYFNPGIFTVNLTVIGVGGANIKIKPDYITVKEAKATPWLPLLLE
ncbi:MAG: PKD domain-containing protein [Deltaproteobacteria bacterium]|nr:PKD domain-containing protein [Deltaproteobacteria bacterium]